MLKRISVKKIITSSIVLCIAFLIYFIPNEKQITINIKEEIEYVNNEINDTIKNR